MVAKIVKKDKKFVKTPVDDFASWQKQAKKNKLSVFDKIYNHYSKVHDKKTAYKYTMETMSKVLLAAGITIKQKDTPFEYEMKKVTIPSFMLSFWIKKAKKDELISLELHDRIEKFVNKYTDLNEKMTSSMFNKLIFKIDTFVAEKAGLKVNPSSPVTFRSRLVFNEDKVVFFSEKYGSQEMSYNLFYKWFTSILSKGNLDPKTYSQMTKYAEKGVVEEPSKATLEFYSGFLKFFGKQFKSEEEVEKKIKKDYPDYFVNEMEKLMLKEVKKLSKLNVGPPKEKVGSVAKIHDKGRTMLKLEEWDSLVGLDLQFYHTLYWETVNNKGKLPSSARYQLYNFLYDKGHGYSSEDAMTVALLLVSFFEYHVATDVQTAKKILEQEKKLKGVPKK